MDDRPNPPLVGLTLRDMVVDHEDRIDELEGWRREIKGATTLVKLLLGSSVLTAVISVLSLVKLLS